MSLLILCSKSTQYHLSIPGPPQRKVSGDLGKIEGCKWGFVAQTVSSSLPTKTSSLDYQILQYRKVNKRKWHSKFYLTQILPFLKIRVLKKFLFTTTYMKVNYPQNTLIDHMYVLYIK